MKKLLSILLAVLMLLGCVPAQASQSSVVSEWPGEYDVLSVVQPGGGDTAFVAVKGEYSNRLICYRWINGAWELHWNRKQPVPHGCDILLTDLSGLHYNGLQLGMAFSIRPQEATGWESVYEQDGNAWTLRMLCWHDTDDTILETFLVEEGVVKYEGWRKNGQQRIYGTLQRDLRYFSWQDFPFAPDALRAVMSEPPRIPGGTLSAKSIRFTGGKKYPVYNGPGKIYGQSGEGSAHVSTNDWIQVFGEENGWIMIQYDISRDHMRIGWIESEALPASAAVREMDFLPIDAVVNSGTYLTDDPLSSQASCGYIREGAAVEWLATMGEWAYVETTGGSLLRGFIPLARVTAETEWEK